MPIAPRRNQEAASRAMAEIEPAYSRQEASVEADRCLFCFDAPCIMGCPTGIDIPGFIKKIADRNPAGAAHTILESNILGASCARVCPTEVLCEGACVLLDRDKLPIKIGRLQRYATDHVYENNVDVLKAPSTKSGKRIACIGGGPASLACAAELTLRGHEAVIFEKNEHAGGLNTFGIAYYKLTPETSLAEVGMVERLGVEIRTGCEVGKDVSTDDLEKDFDAVFLGVGLGHTYKLDIPGEDLPEVVEALDFIRELHVRPLGDVAVGSRVAVIGCGNTAIDAVTQAKRLGADHAVIIYRRDANSMPAYAYEYELAKSDGCEFMFNTVPVAVLGDHSVMGLRLARTTIDARGKLDVIPGSEFDMPFDMVIKALGQEKQVSMLSSLFPTLELTASGTIAVHQETGQTNLPHVFGGGDEANGGAEVVNAVADGKRAAWGIHHYLTGEQIEGPIQKTRYGAETPSGSGFDHPMRIKELEAEYVSRSDLSHG